MCRSFIWRCLIWLGHAFLHGRPAAASSAGIGPGLAFRDAPDLPDWLGAPSSGSRDYPVLGQLAKQRPITERGPDVSAPPPLLYLVPLVAGLVLDRQLPLPRLPRAARPAGLPLLVGGIGLLGWFVSSMVRARTPIDVREAPVALVEAGPFAYTRNSAYLGRALIYTGISLLAGGRWSLLFLPGALVGRRPWRDPTRGALPGAPLRTPLPRLPQPRPALGLNQGIRRCDRGSDHRVGVDLEDTDASLMPNQREKQDQHRVDWDHA